jgi:hypothetical protein
VRSACAGANKLDAWGCSSLADLYSIKPGSSWGTSTKEVQSLWNTSSCDIQMCSYYMYKFDVVPLATYGSMPDDLKPFWDWQQPQASSSCSTLWLGSDDDAVGTLCFTLSVGDCIVLIGIVLLTTVWHWVRRRSPGPPQTTEHVTQTCCSACHL